MTVHRPPCLPEPDTPVCPIIIHPLDRPAEDHTLEFYASADPDTVGAEVGDLTRVFVDPVPLQGKGGGVKVGDPRVVNLEGEAEAPVQVAKHEVAREGI